MSRGVRRLEAWVERLLRDRRPRRFGAEDEEARMMRAAAALHAGRPGADAPRTQFVEKLERDLRRRVEQEDTGVAAPRITRRRLLGRAAAAAAVAAVGAGVDRAVERSTEQGGLPAAELVPPHAGRWVDVAALADVPVGRPLRFSAGAVEGFVVNHGDSVQAVSAICSHMPCTLQLSSSGERLDCPCHGAWFGLDGRPLSGPYYPDRLQPLAQVHTRVIDGRIQVLSA
jgi:cytochrome b6-f complex iron-sulfur subunit